MSYLLDTNVISELVRPKPAKAVLAWFENIPSEALHISVLTLGEIRKGVEQIVLIGLSHTAKSDGSFPVESGTAPRISAS